MAPLLAKKRPHKSLKCRQLGSLAGPLLPVAIRSPLEPSLILLSFAFQNQWMTSLRLRGGLLVTVSGICLCWWVSSKLLADSGVGALSRDRKFSKILKLHCFLPSRGNSPQPPRLFSSYILSFAVSLPVSFSKTRRSVRPGQEEMSLDYSLGRSSGSEWRRDEQISQ